MTAPEKPTRPYSSVFPRQFACTHSDELCEVTRGAKLKGAFYTPPRRLFDYGFRLRLQLIGRQLNLSKINCSDGQSLMISGYHPPVRVCVLTHFTPMRDLAQVQGSDLISGRLPHDVLIVGRTLSHKAGPRCSTNRRAPAGPQSSTARGHPLALITTQPEGTILSCLPICIQPATYLGSGSP